MGPRQWFGLIAGLVRRRRDDALIRRRLQRYVGAGRRAAGA
jgi:hypothetical protein